MTDDADGKEYSHLLKIPANSTSFDQSYDGFTAGGKLISVMYSWRQQSRGLCGDDAAGTDIDSFSHYYTVIDVVSQRQALLSLIMVNVLLTAAAAYRRVWPMSIIRLM